MCIFVARPSSSMRRLAPRLCDTARNKRTARMRPWRVVDTALQPQASGSLLNHHHHRGPARLIHWIDCARARRCTPALEPLRRRRRLRRAALSRRRCAGAGCLRPPARPSSSRPGLGWTVHCTRVPHDRAPCSSFSSSCSAVTASVPSCRPRPTCPPPLDKTNDRRRSRRRPSFSTIAYHTSDRILTTPSNVHAIYPFNRCPRPLFHFIQTSLLKRARVEIADQDQRVRVNPSWPLPQVRLF